MTIQSKVLRVYALTSQIYMLQTKSTHQHLSSSEAPKTQQIAVADIREKPVGFLMAPNGHFSSHNNLANLSFFAKVSVPV